jgi:multiple sugar transport system substrate-binding protein
VVMTPNISLSIPAALRAAGRSEDYHRNAATIDWPEAGVNGQSFPIVNNLVRSVVFEEGGHVATAKEFVRFLVSEGWLAHWLDFAGDRTLPPMPALLRAPFWLDPGDPHRMRSALQLLTRPHTYEYAAVSGDWRHSKVDQEQVWPKAIHRIVTENITPEQATDEAIARVKQLLSE